MLKTTTLPKKPEAWHTNISLAIWVNDMLAAQTNTACHNKKQIKKTVKRAVRYLETL